MGESEQPAGAAEPRRTDVTLIERELTALWKEAEQTEQTEVSSPVIRACSANLIIVSPHVARQAEIDSLLDAVARVHPSRTFLISLDEQLSPQDTETFVSARCSIPLPGEKQVCCEQISLHASPLAFRTLLSVVTSLTVADVPVVLFWREDLSAGDELLSGLTRIADQILFDPPDEGTSPQRPLEAMLRIQNSCRSRVGHLSWERIRPWQALVASSFDDAALRDRLISLREVSIEYHSVPGVSSTLSESLFLVGWIARSLGWRKKEPLKPGRGGSLLGSVLMEGKEIRVSVKGSTTKGGEGGGIRTLRFTGEDEILCVRRMEGDCIRTDLPRNGGKGFPVRLRSDADLLVRQMNMLGDCPGALAAGESILELFDRRDDDDHSDF